MISVSDKIKIIKQPYGGYIKPSSLRKTQYDDGYSLGKENISPAIIGITVDYLTRYCMNGDATESFKSTLIGANIQGEDEYATNLVNEINGLDDKSVINACQLAGFDVVTRRKKEFYKEIRDIIPDETTIKNIRIMINRNIRILKESGPIVLDGFYFDEENTSINLSGSGDYLTKDTLWDLKVSAYNPNSSQTLQILMYYILGLHSTYEEFQNVKKIGLFNPRLNCSYIINIKDIPKNVINEVLDIMTYDTNKDKGIQEYLNSMTGKNTNGKIKQIDKEIEEIYTVTDLMKLMNCSRHIIMRYYAEEQLPLRKKGNRYIISKKEFEVWCDYRMKQYEYRMQQLEIENKKKKLQYLLMLLIPIIIIIIIEIIKSL